MWYFWLIRQAELLVPVEPLPFVNSLVLDTGIWASLRLTLVSPARPLTHTSQPAFPSPELAIYLELWHRRYKLGLLKFCCSAFDFSYIISICLPETFSFAFWAHEDDSLCAYMFYSCISWDLHLHLKFSLIPRSCSPLLEESKGLAYTSGVSELHFEVLNTVPI